MSTIVPVRLAYNFNYPEEYNLHIKIAETTNDYVVFAGKNITIIAYKCWNENNPVITIPLNYNQNKCLCERIAQYVLTLLKVEEVENEVDVIHHELQREIKEYKEYIAPEVIEEKLEELHEKIKQLQELRRKLKELNIIKLEDKLEFDEENYYELILVVRWLKMNKNKVIIKIELSQELWERLCAKYPEITQMPRATAIRYLLFKLL